MGLLGKIFGGMHEEDPLRPEGVTCDGADGVVYAPASGIVVAMADIPDPVFASGAMGPAVGVKPDVGVVYAPVTGEVTVTTGTSHALGIMSDGGVEILIHVGVDTVNMHGDGFVGFVRKGQRVRAGDALMTVDLEKVADAGFDDVVITVVTNADDFSDVSVLASGTATAGNAMLALER